MAKSYLEICRRLSKHLRTDAEKAGIFDHPTGKGDEREEIAKAFLRPRLGTMFDITKAEVIDSDERSSPELDAIVYDRSVGACVHDGATRQVVRVESVALTFECKSLLTKENARETSVKLHDDLLQMQRYYRGSDLLSIAQTVEELAARRLGRAEESLEAPLQAGVSALLNHRDLASVANVVFAFDGPSTLQIAADYMAGTFIDAIFVLGKYTIAKKSIGANSLNQELLLWATGEDAVAGLFDVVEHVLHLYRRGTQWTTPDSMRYSRGRERALTGTSAPE